MRSSLAIAALVLTACATPVPEDASRIDYDRAPPADWPVLELMVYDVPREEMAEACPAGYARVLPGRWMAGCAKLNFCARRCEVWLAHQPEQLRNIALDHEQAHCLGYDHPGSSQGRNAWARAKAGGCGPEISSQSR